MTDRPVDPHRWSPGDTVQAAALAVVGIGVAALSCVLPMATLYLAGVAIAAVGVGLLLWRVLCRLRGGGGRWLALLAVGVAVSLAASAVAVPWRAARDAASVGVGWELDGVGPAFDYLPSGDSVLVRDGDGVRFHAFDSGAVVSEFDAATDGGDGGSGGEVHAGADGSAAGPATATATASTQVALAADGRTLVGVGDEVSVVAAGGMIEWTATTAELGLDPDRSFRAVAAARATFVLRQCDEAVDEAVAGAAEGGGLADGVSLGERADEQAAAAPAADDADAEEADDAAGAVETVEVDATARTDDAPDPIWPASPRCTFVGVSDGRRTWMETAVVAAPMAFARLWSDDAEHVVLPELLVTGDDTRLTIRDPRARALVDTLAGVTPLAAVGNTVVTVEVQADGRCAVRGRSTGEFDGTTDDARAASRGKSWTQTDAELCLHDAVAFGSRLYALTTSDRTITMALDGGTWRYVDESHPVELARPAGVFVSATGIPGDHVIVDRRGGRVEVVDAGSGDVRWSAQFDGDVVGAPTVGDGALVVRSLPAGHNPLRSSAEGVFVSVFDLATGERRGRWLASGGVWAALPVADGRAVVASIDTPALALVGR